MNAAAAIEGGLREQRVRDMRRLAWDHIKTVKKGDLRRALIVSWLWGLNEPVLEDALR